MTRRSEDPRYDPALEAEVTAAAHYLGVLVGRWQRGDTGGVADELDRLTAKQSRLYLLLAVQHVAATIRPMGES